MIKFILSAGSITGPRLRSQVAEAGVPVTHEPLRASAVVCYGAGYNGPLPALNARAGSFNKLRELELMKAAGVATIPFSRTPQGLSYPILGRKFSHTKGKDIIPIFGPREATFAQQGASDFFSQYVPLDKEFRVWAYRRRNIGTYEKVFKYPSNYKRFGCNNQNGFAFEHRENDEGLLNLAAGALEALKLDFGAVDIIQSPGGARFVLEVNTAPGTEQRVIARLAERIVRWHRNGYTKRRGDE